MIDQSVKLLSERLEQGPLSVAEAQQYAAGLADALRRLHDQGTVVTTLDPSRIELAGLAVNIVPGAAEDCVTPYTAPERLQGNPGDTRSDIYSFGALFQEMLTGRKLFAETNADDLRTAILEWEPAPLAPEYGTYAKLLSKCLAKSPLQRWQRMQHVLMELKLQTVVARRNGQDKAARAERVQEMVHAAVGELEGRINARFEAQEAKLAVSAKTEQELRAEIVALEARLASRAEAGERRAAEQESRLARIEQAVKAQGSSIDSLESAIAQTDDLVERVVEALDSLERSVTEQNELRFAAGRN